METPKKVNYLYLFSYGTLRLGNANDHVLKNAEFIKTTTFKGNHTMITPLRQVKGGLAKVYPCLIKTPDLENEIVGEIYKIDESLLPQLDTLEGTKMGLYKRENVEIDGLDCIIYFFTHKLGGFTLVETDFNE